ncbi:MAG: GpE family phage tail protein [Chitinimonas sp.]|nr:GpE family phage tail protein [Chitinimonas sp.]
MAMLARWFRFQPTELDELTTEEFVAWLEQASAQIKNEQRE